MMFGGIIYQKREEYFCYSAKKKYWEVGPDITKSATSSGNRTTAPSKKFSGEKEKAKRLKAMRARGVLSIADQLQQDKELGVNYDF